MREGNGCNFVPVKQLKHTDMDNRNEETQFADEQTTIIEEGVNEVQEPKKTSKWKKTAAMAGVGAAGIAGGIGLSAMASGDDVEAAKQATEAAADADKGNMVKPVGNVKVAEVNDEMSFSEAFASARKQVGAGGVFEWRGKQYGTYYKTEWDSMSQAEKDRYAANVFGTSSSKSSSTSTQEQLQHDISPENLADNSQSSVSGEDIKGELVGVQTVTDENGNPMTIVAAKINGHNSMFVDADVDGYVDVAIMDKNDNEEVELDEIVQISKGRMLVSDLVTGLDKPQPVAEVSSTEEVVPTSMEDVVMNNPLDGVDSLGF